MQIAALSVVMKIETKKLDVNVLKGGSIRIKIQFVNNVMLHANHVKKMQISA